MTPPKLNLYTLLISLALSFLSVSALAENTPAIFMKWLETSDPTFSKEFVNRTNQKFRERFGFLQSRYTDRAQTEWSPAFLAVAEQAFQEKTGRTITEFCTLTNNQMKEGISSSVSRYSALNPSSFSPLYSEYLASNLTLAKNGKKLSPSEANQEMGKAFERIGGLESMGGNAGPGAIAVNFLFDKKGRIVFVGNIQDAPPDIIQQSHQRRLNDGTIRYAVDKKVWQLFTPDNLDPQIKNQLTQDLTEFHQTPPQPSTAAFFVQCDLALKKLLGR